MPRTTNKFTLLLVVLSLIGSNLCAVEVRPQKIRMLYNSLDSLSIAQHLAFYELYPNTEEGRNSLSVAWRLLSGGNERSAPLSVPLLNPPIQALISLINKQPNDTPPALSPHDLTSIEKISSTLANRKLKGHYAQSEAEVIALTSEEIDLARGLFLSQFGTSEEAWKQLRAYEAHIDLMALQIRARLPNKATAEEKITHINNFIFYEMGFRFPPHSLYAKEIDLYTFLPSVLDSRQGVCLGVSILYLAIAQRLDLPLEIVTPPGHIYIRCRSGKKLINIETTARGVHIDCEEYLSIDTLKLQQRNLKEVIGMAHFNQASSFLAHKQPCQALKCYEKAASYTPDDMLVKELMGICCILAGEDMRGRRLLQQTAGHLPDYAVSGSTTADDYLAGAADAEALATILMHVDETRESILTKQKTLQTTIARCPRFKSAYFALASAWMQLHRHGEALETLEAHHRLEPNDPTAEYYMAALYAERHNFPKAWVHLRQAELLTKARGYSPKPLKELRQELHRHSPDDA